MRGGYQDLSAMVSIRKGGLIMDKETVDKAVSSGADGYILKEMDNEKIISSIKAVAGGINVFCDNTYFINTYYDNILEIHLIIKGNTGNVIS